MNNWIKSYLQKEAEELPHEGLYTRLAPSKIHGVGVIAIRDIPKDTEIFHGDNSSVRWVNKSDFEALPIEVQQMYEDFCIISDKGYGGPTHFNAMPQSWYLNENKIDPNVMCDPGRDFNFFALRDIKKGEELTVNYSTFSDERQRTLK